MNITDTQQIELISNWFIDPDLHLQYGKDKPCITQAQKHTASTIKPVAVFENDNVKLFIYKQNPEKQDAVYGLYVDEQQCSIGEFDLKDIEQPLHPTNCFSLKVPIQQYIEQLCKGCIIL